MSELSIADRFRLLFGGRPAAPQPEPPKPKPLVPRFYSPVGYGPNGYMNRFMNPDYFAAPETADEVMRRFEAVERFERIAPGNEGPLYTCSHLQWWVRFDDGLELNAGILAAFFQRGPEDKFPGVAEAQARDYIRRARDEKALEVQTRANMQAREEGGGAPSVG